MACTFCVTLLTKTHSSSFFIYFARVSYFVLLRNINFYNFKRSTWMEFEMCLRLSPIIMLLWTSSERCNDNGVSSLFWTPCGWCYCIFDWGGYCANENVFVLVLNTFITWHMCACFQNWNRSRASKWNRSHIPRFLAADGAVLITGIHWCMVVLHLPQLLSRCCLFSCCWCWAAPADDDAALPVCCCCSCPPAYCCMLQCMF